MDRAQGYDSRGFAAVYNVAILHDELMLKLKKLDSSLRSRNIPTGQTRAFELQESLLPMTAGEVTNAISGYVVDGLGGGIAGLFVVCWDGGHQLWRISLDEEDRGVGGPIVTIPAYPTPSRPERRRTIVRSSELKPQSK
jgi:hypothetical protein